MKFVNTFLTLAFIFLTVSIIVFSVNIIDVCAVPKPSVPQFTVKFIDNSYNVPPTQTTNPYTGETTTQPSYQVKESRIDVTINNLPSTSHKTPEGYECNLYYRVQYKGHFEENWYLLSGMDYGVADDYYAPFVASSNGKYTVVSCSFNDFNTPPLGAQLDFRVQALYAYHDPTTINHIAHVHEALLVEETSGDWSSIQTITINYRTSSPSPSQTANSPNTPTSEPYNPPQQPLSLNLKVILIATCIIAILIAVIAHQYKQIKNNFDTTSSQLRFLKFYTLFFWCNVWLKIDLRNYGNGVLL